MINNTPANTQQKKKLHPRNKHIDSYNFNKLVTALPELKEHVFISPNNVKTIDFSNPDAVRALNKALLKLSYGIEFWDIPKENLCPPIPGRADYIHYIADILAEENNGKLPRGPQINVLDVGVGANCIYPIIGTVEYGWSFVGSEIVKKAYKNAIEIARLNPVLKNNVQIRQQLTKDIFRGIIQPEDKFDITICNPPFFSSQLEALAQTERKIKSKITPNSDDTQKEMSFGGQGSELWCDGGEKAFITQMIAESRYFRTQVKWFSTLVAHRENVRTLEHKLKKANAKDVRVIKIEQGNKIARILLWRF
ncbi:23S rRNA (adenine(1618)-N(6))-methyltransferase RlmF [Sphingobacteriaceae bacterium WQ 2009]|uniref:Ribosomal RNA large subunit methyltransferase F n=1 Tax=Rhinopithecimicrobium faecis TaxID=2820698 RepID=A0A8T4H6Q8_9SPHI|nr:23S rRNA (adenine(1618)-N(6))-methyltransferase RlmF [Sphingobacteriaceae bacterium WQ 2009]